MFVLDTSDMLFLMYQPQQHVKVFGIFEPTKEFQTRAGASEISLSSILSQIQMFAEWS
jgi:hypothetical protein